jgi:carbamate kinase
VLIVVALGGNALLRRGEPVDAEVQARNVKTAARTIAELARDHRVVVTHGNGPQVGLLALQAAAYGGTKPYPLDVLGAESEGMVGYLLDQAIANELPQRDIATLLTQVVVDPDDAAFARPSKPVGPVYDAENAQRVANVSGWSVAPEGSGWRRVVPSPTPRDIVELRTIEFLVDGDVIVICGGGGGIPVMIDDHGALRGVEAVIDKDASSGLLAGLLAADHLLLLTDVDGVSLGWGTPGARLIRRADPDTLAQLDFASGSMGPKVAAACRFVEETGRDAAIGSLTDAAAILRGEAGTTISSHADGILFAGAETPEVPPPS